MQEALKLPTEDTATIHVDPSGLATIRRRQQYSDDAIVTVDSGSIELNNTIVAAAVDEISQLLSRDPFLSQLCEIANRNMSRDGLRRELTVLLKSYSEELVLEAKTRIQKEATTVIRRYRQRIASVILGKMRGKVG